MWHGCGPKKPKIRNFHSFFILDNFGIYQVDNTKISSMVCCVNPKMVTDNMATRLLIPLCDAECCLLLIFVCILFPCEIFFRKINEPISTEYGKLFLYEFKLTFNCSHLNALVPGLIDNSGLRLFHTTDIRKYDAGVIEAGLWVSLFHTIPPGLPEFRSEGHCTLECLEEVHCISVFELLFPD